ncbi:hypothetical protein TeGR_g6353 [Tetraparma gracilis]|uniref:Trypsin-like serine protease n=1 Tax=Tetraparma gracilis TaxID=2962635 RepID=A0ABQ6N7D1_9STRA|nr:hypothetical protein TeGR_g6353 [Tetraparma gracilis]
MARHEVLSQSSCFLVKHPLTPTLLPPVVVASQHVCAPFHYPNYYGHLDWISHVRPEHVRCTAEVRNADGSVASVVPLSGPLHHPERDVTLLSLSDPGDAEALGLPVLELGELGVGGGFVQGREVTCEGHAVQEEAKGEGEETSRNSIPEAVRCFMALASPKQTFIYPTAPLVDGMCGGPVIEEEGGRVLGILEGIVPDSHHQEQMRGLGSIVGADEIKSILSQTTIR